MRVPVPASTASGVTSDDAIFGHVLVGIDETPESLVAAAQAAVLRAPDGHLALLAVAERYLAAHAGLGAAHAEDDVFAGTSAALERAKGLVDADTAVLATGRFIDRLRAGCEAGPVTLVAVGVRPHRRLSAVTFGGHDVEALHDLRCAVLIARPGWGPSKPEQVVVGVDGSPESRTAEVVGRSLATRLGCEIVPVVGLGGTGVDPAVLRSEREDGLLDPGDPVHAVVDASSKRSLIVVGRAPSSGRRGGGPLVDRIVYSARCSVLVVQHGPGAAA